jgi:hypothetical protein
VAIRQKRLAGMALAVAFSGGVAIAEPGHAATQGNLGASSTATVAISASVPARARITGLADIAMLNLNPTTTATRARNVCVWSNTASRRYRITASGSGASNAFALANGTLSVPYAVQWNARAGRTTGTTLNAGVASAVLTSLATHQSCASGPTASASLIVQITAANLGTMQAATVYAGTLTLIVAPV